VFPFVVYGGLSGYYCPQDSSFYLLLLLSGKENICNVGDLLPSLTLLILRDIIVAEGSTAVFLFFCVCAFKKISMHIVLVSIDFYKN